MILETNKVGVYGRILWLLILTVSPMGAMGVSEAGHPSHPGYQIQL